MTYNACQSLPLREKLKLNSSARNYKFSIYKYTSYVSLSIYEYTYLPYIVSREPTSRAHSRR